ncbi:lipocalin family protein [Thalassotalea castellviae]|uniref:Outer membrane lipoprotein Blc n=1 Tax=Thalassotalea castellviae TaxID=3075612 RepID=A0ABU3A4N9_9GAMM|nr:lipocalin family protein [Thalassotalea sp. W431]MDT0604775.1 lipocalin family protein [Thalassotalea sp. W431]
MKKLLLSLILMLMTGCLGMPQLVQPVNHFELNKYLGKWYEIARLEHSFEQGLSKVSAEYSLLEDGGVSVINRGFSTETQTWQEAEGKAYFVNDETQGYLKVSFFGPFYGSYVVFELERDNYDYAFVSGPNHDYLWLLARSPSVSQEIKTKFEKTSKDLGFDIRNLIYVEQN